MNISAKEARVLLGEKAGSKLKSEPVWECRDCKMVYYHALEKSGKDWICPNCEENGPGPGEVWYYQSRKEFNRWHVLNQAQKAGQIRNLRRQVPFTFEFEMVTGLVSQDVVLMAGKRKLTYVADFVYEENSGGYSEPPHAGPLKTVWLEVVEDCKGARTPVYKIKKELMRVVNGIEIRES